MATGLTVIVGGVAKDLDELFVAGSSSVTTGIIVGGTDLGGRYMGSTGGDTLSTATGITVGGTDLRNFWRWTGYVPPEPASLTSLTANSYSHAGDTVVLTAVAWGDAPITYSWKKDGVTISGETGSTLSFTAGTSTNGVYEVTASNAYGSSSMTIGVTVDPPLTASLTGPSEVHAGVFVGETWNFSAHADFGLTRVRFGVEGHGSGSWLTVSGDDYSDSATWGDPFGYPSISFTPGTYTFYFEAEDAQTPFNLAIHVEKSVLVSP